MLFMILFFVSSLSVYAENKKLTQLIVTPRIVKSIASGKLREWPQPFSLTTKKSISFPAIPVIVEIK